MLRNTIRLVIILAITSIIGIIFIQFFWVKRAFDMNEKQFNQTVTIALTTVADRLLKFDNQQAQTASPVSQLSENYFVVRVNGEIDANLLEIFLIDEFQKRNVKADFEYSIYDCQSEKMVYGKYVDLTDEAKIINRPPSNLPKWLGSPYYFGVYFPSKTSTLIGEMQIWIFSSIVLLIVVIFFGYTLFIILQQRRLSEVQKDFINNMTHEFKTPIATISISSEVLKNPKIVEHPERLLKYATIIHEEANRLKKQVESVLQIAVVDNTEIKLKQEETNVHEIITKAVASVKTVLETRKGSINYQFDAVNPNAFVDVLHFTNIIYNLLDNAIKYCKKTPQIYVRTQNYSYGIYIHIVDNGIGISKEAQRHIFEKFYRVHTGNVHDVKGFGLGLNYVKLMLKAHGGTIQVSSKSGEGSTFTIFLPVIQENKEKEAVTPKQR